ncbi:fad binding domain-containing [Trichoderma arundinaceum]|uniref:Fad binding domain-containing n=1 Tax=Trichoderma arundinaceum TaxID=490622 RepID=A0A395NM27_TRIAR|nr:fad binding domain-containing [Trichoderma arundinaceum]
MLTHGIYILALSLFGQGTTAHTYYESSTVLKDVDARMMSYLETVQNGTASVKGLPPRATLSGCSLACNFLDSEIPGSVSFPGSPAYSLLAAGYWTTQQAETNPGCRFSPNSVFEVAQGVLALRSSNCKFAVKSGGHSVFSGASSIEGGVTIHLANLKQLGLSADQSQLSVGTGNRWVDVMSFLDGKGITVIGGRVAGVGVGGLPLGGGISYFSGRHGWSCHNINSYEVVFADGTVRDVSFKSDPDLYFALRGGGNNFGIVTRYDFKTVPQGNLWAGAQTFVYSKDNEKALNEALYNLNIASDPEAGSVLTYTFDQSNDRWLIASAMYYGKPIDHPSAFANFTAVPGAISDTLRVAKLVDVALEFNASNPSGFRRTTWGLTVKNDPVIMAEIDAIFIEEYNKVKDAKGLSPALIHQTISTNQLSHFDSQGGNPFGLTEKDGPLNLIEINVAWSSAKDDNRVIAAARNTISRGSTAAQERNVLHPYVFLNYANPEQDPFPSYGAENHDRLKTISQKYDPQQVWQKLLPGYFKL